MLNFIHQKRLFYIKCIICLKMETLFNYSFTTPKLHLFTILWQTNIAKCLQISFHLVISSSWVCCGYLYGQASSELERAMVVLHVCVYYVLSATHRQRLERHIGYRTADFSPGSDQQAVSQCQSILRCMSSAVYLWQDAPKLELRRSTRRKDGSWIMECVVVMYESLTCVVYNLHLILYSFLQIHLSIFWHMRCELLLCMNKNWR